MVLRVCLVPRGSSAQWKPGTFGKRDVLEHTENPQHRAWIKRHVSRETLRWNDHGQMQIRGSNTGQILFKNHRPLLSKTTDAWSPPISLQPGDVISFQRNTGETTLLLELLVVVSDQSVEEQQTSQDHPSGTMTHLQDTSTPIMLKRLEQKIEDDARRDDRFLNGTENSFLNGTENSFLNGTENRHVVHASVNCKRPMVKQEETTPPNKKRRTHPLQGQPKQNPEPPYTILFVPLGRDLTLRIPSLTRVARDKGARVVTDWDPALTHLVVSKTVALPVLAKHFGVTPHKLQTMARSMVAVTPDYVVHCKGHFRTPKLSEEYTPLTVATHSPTNKPRLAKRNAASMSDQTVQHRQGDDIVAEVPPHGDKRERNVEISNLIQKLAKLYQKAPFDKNDEMRAYTFFLVAGRLKCLDFDVATDPMASEKLKNTKGIGESCLKIINEWIRTRKISRLEQASEQETRISFRNLIQIWGVGPTKARELHHQNYRTIEQVREGLRKRELSLNDNQLVGVECYEDFLLKMTRTEVQVIWDIVCRELSEMLPTATVEIMGSYRRGKEECGDIDLLITDPNYVRTTPRLALGELVSRLEEKGHISHHLTNITDLGREDRSDSQSSCGRRGDYDHYDKSQSYMGVFCSPVDQGKHRRIDIKIYPYRSKAFATLYFTGCGWFNRSMRLWAKRAKNLHLNDHGLFPGDGRLHHVPSVNEQLPFEASTEMEIFAKLGLVYKQPQERNCFDDVVSKDGETVAKLDINDTEAYREERLRNNLDVYEELED